MELTKCETAAGLAEAVARSAPGVDFEKAVMVRRELGLDGVEITVPPGFDDPAFSLQVLGLEGSHGLTSDESEPGAGM